jgi:integrase
MSGGPYGRGKAPERACLRIEKWPEIDRRLWLAACVPGDILEDDIGARSGHSEISNGKAVKGYGRWLTFVVTLAPGTLLLPPAERITRERVRAYVDSLIELGNATQTILARLQELGEVARVMGPNRAWSFLNEFASKIRARHRPARDKSNLRLSNELVDLGFALMAGTEGLTGLDAAIAYRDGLVIAFLALIPLRRRNLAALVLDRTLFCQGSQWLIAFGEDDTKTHAAFEIGLPEVLREPLEVYLQVHRPVLAARAGRWSRPVAGALWVSKDGSPMTQMALYDRIRARTKQAFGRALNPHLFRDAAATTMSIADPAGVHAAAPLLGHRTFATTERYYRQSLAQRSHRAFVDVLFDLKSGGPDER